MSMENIIELEVSTQNFIEQSLRTNDVVELDIGLEEPCPYYLGDGIAAHFPEYLNRAQFDKVVVVSSRIPFDLFGQAFLQGLKADGISVTNLLIDDQEPRKNWETLASLCEALIQAGVTRDSVLVALGGGVVGNVVGLAAGLIFRGIRYIEVPTTLMAQSDGVLSRKQAINGLTGKNQFGLYHTPLFIWADVEYPRHEPLRQTQSAIVEGVKNGLVNSPEWLDELSGTLENGMDAIYQDLKRFTFKLIDSKLPILRRDPSEKKEAVILEYGHTFGHAIEWLSRGTLYHGEAVSIGMCTAAELSFSVGLMKRDVLQLHYHVLGELLGAPVRIPNGLSPEHIYQAMLNDNKRTSSGLTFLLLEQPGQLYKRNGSYLTRVNPQHVLNALQITGSRAA